MTNEETELLNEILSRVPDGEKAYQNYLDLCSNPRTPLGLAKKYGRSLEDIFTMYENNTLYDYLHASRGRKKTLYRIYNESDELLVFGTIEECAKFFNLPVTTLRSRMYQGDKEFSEGYRYEKA